MYLPAGDEYNYDAFFFFLLKKKAPFAAENLSFSWRSWQLLGEESCRLTEERNSKRAPRALCKNLQMLTSHRSVYNQRKAAVQCLGCPYITRYPSLRVWSNIFLVIFLQKRKSHMLRGHSLYSWNSFHFLFIYLFFPHIISSSPYSLFLLNYFREGNLGELWCTCVKSVNCVRNSIPQH